MRNWKLYILILILVLSTVFFIKYEHEFCVINSIIGEGILKIEKPEAYNEDYRLMLYQNDKSDPQYVFSDLKKKNGLFLGIEDIVVEDFTGDGWEDIFIVSEYEKYKDIYYDFRIYVAVDDAYILDVMMMEKFASEYNPREAYPIEKMTKEIKTAYAESEYQGWEHAYRRVLCNLEEYIPDPEDFYQFVTLGFYDFDGNGVPEMILGNHNYSVSIFTYEEGKVKKIKNLNEGILHFKDGIVMMVRSNISGSIIKCFAYRNNEYIEGLYDYYTNNDITIQINGENVSKKEFDKFFDLHIGEWRMNWSEYTEGTLKPFFHLEKDNVDFRYLDFNDFWW